MRLLSRTQLIFERFSEGQFNKSGLWEDGAIRRVPVKGSLQPYQSGVSSLTLPEGVMSSDVKVFYTADEVLSANHLKNTQADEVSIGGVKYTVKGVMPFTNTGLNLDHYEVYLYRKDKNESEDKW